MHECDITRQSRCFLVRLQFWWRSPELGCFRRRRNSLAMEGHGGVGFSWREGVFVLENSKRFFEMCPKNIWIPNLVRQRRIQESAVFALGSSKKNFTATLQQLSRCRRCWWRLWPCWTFPPPVDLALSWQTRDTILGWQDIIISSLRSSRHGETHAQWNFGWQATPAKQLARFLVWSHREAGMIPV